MKTLTKLFCLALCFCLCFSCNEIVDDNLPVELKSAHEKTVTVGFNVVFTGDYTGTAPSGICGAYPPMIRVINNGEGTGTHLGHFTSHFEFCVDLTDGTYPHGHLIAKFVDRDGDELKVWVEGTVFTGRLPGMPAYAYEYFRDPWEILGGTGKFEGATGSGFTNDYNSSKDDYSHHHWKGKITLKQKRNK